MRTEFNVPSVEALSFYTPLILLNKLVSPPYYAMSAEGSELRPPKPTWRRCFCVKCRGNFVSRSTFARHGSIRYDPTIPRAQLPLTPLQIEGIHRSGAMQEPGPSTQPTGPMGAPDACDVANSTGHGPASNISSPSGSKRTLEPDPDAADREGNSHEDDNEAMDRMKRLRQESPQWDDFDDTQPDGSGSDSMDIEPELDKGAERPKDGGLLGEDRDKVGGEPDGGNVGREGGGTSGDEVGEEGEPGSGNVGREEGSTSEDEVEEEGRGEVDDDREEVQGQGGAEDSSESSDEETPEDAQRALETEAARLLERQRQDATDQQQQLLERQQQRAPALGENNAPIEPEQEILADEPPSRIRHLNPSENHKGAGGCRSSSDDRRRVQVRAERTFTGS